MALYLLDRNKDGASILASTLEKAIDNIQRCESCRMLTSNNKCNVCLDSSRDSGSICVVESPSDVLAIESTGGFRGKYFVLLGRLSPIDGVGPEDLGIDNLLKITNQFYLDIHFYVPATLRDTNMHHANNRGSRGIPIPQDHSF